MRKTKKLRELLALFRSQGSPTTYVSHEAAYWQAAQLGLTYSPIKGWHEPPVRRGRQRQVAVRIEGSFHDCVAVELALREAGHVPEDRRGPDRGRGDGYLTYLSLPMPPMAKAPLYRRRT